MLSRNTNYLKRLNSRLLKLAFPAITFAPLLVAWLFHVFISQTNPNEYVQEVSQNLQKEAALADDIIYDLKEKVSVSPQIKFDELLSNAKYPVYVFTQQQLVFWSDFRYNLPYYEYFAGFFAEKCIETRNAVFYVKKSLLLRNNQDYEVVCLIPLQIRYSTENEYLRPYLNESVFPSGPVKISTGQGKGRAVKNKFGSYLFSVEFNGPSPIFPKYRWWFLSLFVISVLSLFSWIWYWTQQQFRKEQYLKSWFAITLLLLAIRVALPFLPLTYYFSVSPQWSSEASFPGINSSFWGIMINVVLTACWLYFTFFFFRRIFPVRQFYRLSFGYKLMFASVMMCVSFLLAHGLNSILSHFYNDAGILIDITESIDLDAYQLLVMFCFVLGASLYTLGTYMVVRIVLWVFVKVTDVGLAFGAGAILYYATALAMNWNELPVLNIHAFFLATITFWQLPLQFQKSGYYQILFVLIGAISAAAIGAYGVQKNSLLRISHLKDTFASRLVGNDEKAELLLANAIEKIGQDQIIVNAFANDQASKELVEKKIKRIYLNEYFDRYETTILFFDAKGNPLEPGKNLPEFERQFIKPRYKTLHQGLLFINEIGNGLKSYVTLIPLKKEDKTVGTILLQFDWKLNPANSVQPFFLTFPQYSFEYGTISYAVFDQGELTFTKGEFLYRADFLQHFKVNGQWLDEVEKDGYHHLQVAGDLDKVLVVSSPVYPFDHLFSNFSFFFLVLVFAFVSVVGFPRKPLHKINFATKIQFSVNLAFFVPLTIVTVVIVSILNRHNYEEARTNYIEKAQSISLNLIGKLQQLKAGAIRLAQFETELKEMAALSQSGIYVYSPTGKLVASSENHLFDTEMMAEYINPIAYQAIMEDRQSSLLVNEQISQLRYQTAYVSIKSTGSALPLGIVGIPFFQAQYKRDVQIIAVITSIMKVFSLVFVMLLTIAYFTSRSLVKPLKLVTQKLKKTTFLSRNEPLDYQSEDELGLLVGEYNRMISKLDESMAALARTEKETAWREMAKQVAHEIKNPLTPMKLTIQQLQRVMLHADTNAQKAFEVLLTQIETLSDIATSFSAFAKMPNPKEERFEIGSVIRKTLELYVNDQNLKLFIDLPDEEFFVIGDERLMSRILTNLILNGIQSVSKEQMAEITVTLSSLLPNEKVLIEVKDNGQGIAEYIRNKVFIPNFSTKSHGSGIGLAIAKRGIEHSGGNIWFETELGKGTSFFIELPLFETTFPANQYTETE